MDNSNQPLDEKTPILANPLLSSNTTTDDVYKKRKKESKESQIQGWLELAAIGGSTYAIASIVNNDPTFSFLLSKMPGANRYAEKYKIARDHAIGGGFNPVNLESHYKQQSFGKSILSIISSVEELSPFHILKTLQLSNILEPLTEVSRKPKDIHLTGSAIESSLKYYDNMITDLTKGKQKLTADDLKNGLIVRNNKLYRFLEDGKTLDDKPILNYVKTVTNHIKLGDKISPNRIALKFANTFNTSLSMGTFNKEQTLLVGGKSRADFALRWADAITRQALEVGYKTLDNPLGGMEDLIKAAGGNTTGFFESKGYRNFKSKLNFQLGTGGRYNLSTPDSLKLMTKNLGGKVLLAYAGYQAVNHILDNTTPKNSAWNDGIVSGATATYANTRVKLAHLIADPFQKYKEKQEQAAKGSTNLSTLIGFPLVGAVVAGSLPYYQRIYQSGSKGIEKATAISDEEIYNFGFTKKMSRRLEDFGIGKGTKSKSLAFKGALVGGLLAAPFLPGALVTQSSDELKKKYSGKELEANRANAYWMAGGSSWEGEQIKNFRPSRVARILADNKKDVLYDGSNKKQRDEDPIYSPFKYLRNPYKFEEEHKEDMPYPVWGMNVDYGSFLGKIYQGTVGEIIKPTVVNEQFLEDSKALSTTSAENYRKIKNERFGDRGKGNSLSIDFNSKEPIQINNSEGGYPTLYTPKSKDKQLIESGQMLPESSPSVDSAALSLSQTYNSFTDFTGLKGFTTSLTINKLGYDPEEIRTQLSRSGESRSVAKDITNENLGDMLGLGELQRRIVSTSANSRIDEVNPMHNSVAPSWLPHDESKYYLDFSKGDYWNKVQGGVDRLPGKGFANLNPDMKNVDPEDYPLVYRYKVLSDVAAGSPEQISLRENLLKNRDEGRLNQDELDIFNTTLTQEQEKSKKKQFSEYTTPEERENLSLVGKGLNTLWETTTHNSESPLEPLTPFRPGAKFIHKRSAIEDYQKTMLEGPDTAIWTNPYSHFIKPTINRLINLIPGVDPVTKDAEERGNVNEYFDKLSYLRSIRNNKPNDALRTVEGSVASGILDKDSMNKFKSSLTAKERDYVDSFAQAKSEKDRKKILQMTPVNIGEAYKQIWENLDVAEKAKSKGEDPLTAIKENYVSKNKHIMDYFRDYEEPDYKGMIDRVKNLDLDGGKDKKLNDEVNRVQSSKLKEAEQDSAEYVENKTGMPDNNWVGWDPRLTTNDIKLRTLRIGKADTYDYGFWDGDIKRNDRITSLDNDKQVSNKLEAIKHSMKSDLYRKKQVEDTMFSKGFYTRRITLTDATRDDAEVRVRKDE